MEALKVGPSESSLSIKREPKKPDMWGLQEAKQRNWLIPGSALRTRAPESAKISAAINASRNILELEDDWDGEGSRSYLIETWTRATEFLRLYALRSWERHGTIIDAPRILPGPDGSIDIHWKSGLHELLVNIPVDPTKPASFYGDDYGIARIEGTFDSFTFNLGLLSWLTDHS